MSDTYRHYYGFCEDDNVIVQIEIHPDAGRDATLPTPEDWEDFGLRCPVCGDTVPGGYDGADDFTTDAERGARARVAEAKVARAETLADEWEADSRNTGSRSEFARGYGAAGWGHADILRDALASDADL